MRATRGFTLIELLVALSLAGLVVAGAFQMHLAFNRQSQRQQQVAEVQQTLRVAMQVIERAIRTAGDGLGSSHTFPGMAAGCTPTTYYGFQFSNDNTYADPKKTFWNPATPDTDPDWFRVVAANDSGGAVFAGSLGVNVTFVGSGTQTWNVGDLFVPVVPAACLTSAYCLSAGTMQIYEVTSGFTGNTTWASPGSIKNQNGGSCYNPPPGNDTCIYDKSGRPKGCPQTGPGTQLRHFSGGGTVYRIMTALDQGDSGAANAYVSPKLTMRTAPFGTAFYDPSYPWIPIADNIEDMQIAVIIGGSGADAGTICGVGGVSDNPASCNFANAAAVRVTLVARSSQPIAGVPPTPLGGYEDEPSRLPTTATRDAYYLRRAMTATIQLRNYAP